MPWCAPSASTAGLLLSDGTTWVAGVPGVLSISGLQGQSGGATHRREAMGVLYGGCARLIPGRRSHAPSLSPGPEGAAARRPQVLPPTPRPHTGQY
jgi:hypothetical protein